jgi:cell division protein FtsB
MYRKSRESDQKKQNIERRIAELNEKQIDLEAKISELSTEEGIDALIREKYRVAKEGEQLVIILNEEKEIEEEGISTREGFWLKIRGIFSN